MPEVFSSPESVMQRALELAVRGQGFVEPNPLVGAVIVDDQLQKIAEGYHQRYGGPHAEVEALRAAGSQAVGAHIFVTLEPCNHHGKTPPCTEAVIAAGIKKVTIGCLDPAAHTTTQGVARLRAAGLEVQVGLLQEQAELLLRPFAKRIQTGIPYVHAKWAMTLDGKIATRTGSSQWISQAASRQIVHELRGRMDGIVVGRGTVQADDPELTARPAGPRTPVRIIIDSHAQLAADSRLIKTLPLAPVLLVCLETADTDRRQRLTDLGVEVLPVRKDATGHPALHDWLAELGRRGMTNLLIEGGGELLGSFLDQREIDEVHVFVAPKLIGGSSAPGPIAGQGLSLMSEALPLEHSRFQNIAGDLYFQGLVPHVNPTEITPSESQT